MDITEGHEEQTTAITVTVIPAETPEIPGRLVISDAQPSTTIGELKNKIQALIPSHPALQRLRLICAGMLLSRDEATLQQIVGAESLRAARSVTIHLALRPNPDGHVRVGQIPAMQPPPPTTTAAAAAARAPQPQVVFGPSLASQQLPHIPSPPLIPSSTPTSAQQIPTQDTNTTPVPTSGQTQEGANGEERRRAYEQMMRQHQLAHQAFLQQAMQNTGIMVPQPWGAMPPGPLPIQDFQRHFNLQHNARHAGEGDSSNTGNTANPAETSTQNPSTAQATTQQTTEAPQIPQMPLGQPVPLGPMFGPQGIRTTHMQINRMPMPAVMPSGAGFASRATPASSIVHNGAMQNDTIYLLSSPDGYQAILLAPPHPIPAPISSLTGALRPNVPIPSRTVTIRQTAISNNAGNNPALRNQHEIRQDRQVAPQPIGFRDLLGLIMPFGGHLWLILRLTFFAVILSWGATWSRTLLVCFGFVLIFLSQTGLLTPIQGMAEQAWMPIRRHLEGLVRDIDIGQDQGEPAAPDGQQEQPRAVAARQAQQRDQGLVRRAERTVALFVASFVPGVGEAQVTARQERERRARREAEEREAQARREQQEEAAPPEPESSNSGDMGPSPWTGPADATQEQGLRRRQATVDDASDEGDE